MADDIVLKLDIEPLLTLQKDLTALEPHLQQQAAALAAQAHAHVLELAQQGLHSRRQMYVDALKKPEEIAPGIWAITLEQSAIWIEDGKEPHWMGDYLLKPGAKGVKTAKDGSLYRVIPFSHSGAPNTKTQAAQTLIDTIKNEFKNRGIPWSGIEKGPDGKPKSGLIHKFDINTAPNRPAGTEGKPGWGKGAVGQVMQGPAHPQGDPGIPFLRGIRVYQKALEGQKDSKGNQKFGKSVMTFRVISSKHKAEGKWKHPGLQPMAFFQKTADWAEREWSEKILPQIIKNLGAE